jgi:hypothetical protein
MQTTPETNIPAMVPSQNSEPQQQSTLPQTAPPYSPPPSEMPSDLGIYGANREILEFIKHYEVPVTVLPKPARIYTSEELQTILEEEAETIIERRHGTSELTASEILDTLHMTGKCQDLKNANSIGDALGKGGLNVPRYPRNGRTYYNLKGISLSKTEKEKMQQIMNAKILMQRQKRGRQERSKGPLGD